MLLIDSLSANMTLAKSELTEASEIVDSVKPRKSSMIDASDVIDKSRQKLKEQYLSEAKELVNSALHSKKEFNVTAKQAISAKELINFDNFTSGFDKIKIATNAKEQMPDLLVFASFSLPKQTLKQLAEQVRKTQSVLVFRGIHEGSLKKTISLIHELDKQGTSAIIHPKLFKEYNINTVPTFVLSKADNSCLPDKCTSIVDKIGGNIPLQYVLETFAKKSDHKQLAKAYLKKLGGIL